jgi:predicted regulator of Ras-like GTPase activity (Roadblock/LC7/MglB family)
MRSISTVAAGTYLGDPGARMSMVESDSGYLFVREAGPGALLAVLARAEVDARLLYQQMDLLVARIGEYLSAAPRSDGEYAR